MVFLSQLQTRNIVGNLLQLPQDQAQVKSINTEMRNVQLEIQRPLIEAMERDPRVFNQRMYAIEDRITENGDDLEDALAQDEERWKQIASERSEGMDEDRENLAIQLQVPNNKLAEEIRKLKEGIKNAPEGPIREFLKKALSDYRVSRTIQAMNVTADVCFAVDCTGSMGTFLGYTKQIVKELLAELRRNFPYVSVRMAFVGYRDFDDYGSPSYEVVPFGTVETVSPQLEGVEALSGFGGDW